MASEPGDVDASVRITYENARGEEQELTQEFTVNVMESEMSDGIDEDEFPDEGVAADGGLPPFVRILIAAALAAVVVAVTVILVKRRKAKRMAAEEFDDEDAFDDEDYEDIDRDGSGDAS
ncbi:MAG: hypothetical protein LBH63_05125, partial [Clostridiales Family XIII bacterium]|jgi:hypothetical protein|nr:hypothetical protein [Clostridiales Family XIII bacterium]